MEKKKYVKPSMEVYELPERQMKLCYSSNELGYLHGQQPDDEKKLA
jgi:hypothetical protein